MALAMEKGGGIEQKCQMYSENYLYYTTIFLYKNINCILVCPCGFYFVIIKHGFSVYER